ncbi:hypothetical protein CHS0354_040778 [Potamilus streckersoni]|uniref:Uncharacterized protein n=1 Tax=Potamilus streckersoni TaxID=2493646 RepID=A0AAE0SLB8_9BIVA|nr:hypothetical protein CHS0354_040778 [Potamilus streckersoni]
MPMTTKAVQTRSINVSLLVDFIWDIITTGRDIREHYQCNMQILQQSRCQMSEADDKVESLMNGISDCNNSIQKLNVRILQQNVAVAEKSLINQKLRSEIADMQKKLERYKRMGQESQVEAKERTFGDASFQTMKQIREEKGKLELQLYKLNHDIEAIYEETSEKENKLENIKTMRQDLRMEHEKSMESLRAACKSLDERKKKLLSLSVVDQQAINLSGLYADPKEFSRLQQEFNNLKNKQNLVERNIKEQKQEEEYLQSNVTELMRRQHEFQRIIRKRNGVDGTSAPTSPPIFKGHDLGGPNVWFASPVVTIAQLRRFLNEKYGKYASPSVQTCAITERNSSSPSLKDVTDNTSIHEKEDRIVMSSI